MFQNDFMEIIHESLMPEYAAFGRLINPPWMCADISVNLEMSAFPKDSTSPQLYRSLFRQTMPSRFHGYKIIFTDGSKNKGAIGAAHTSVLGEECSRLHPWTSVFTAELYAIHRALSQVLSTTLEGPIVIISYSMSSIKGIQSGLNPHPLIGQIRDIHASLQGRGLTDLRQQAMGG
ncbi:hypothetical protein GWI33_018590 [Rhynchophorus ferrugineus]|uniref:RNase H type-1 domain-containing protein n=1 Tax=Rhynchophorus ferrugineus TaxID=354439 RepID=A0A834M1B6_RHYFE|nr:hypothetical protein GWI33_018590 [Rhynchophorus ferrugineus]